MHASALSKDRLEALDVEVTTQVRPVTIEVRLESEIIWIIGPAEVFCKPGAQLNM
jgi:hypothetical protein